MKSMAPTAVGMSFAKRRLLRAGIILYGAKVTRLLDPSLLAYILTSLLAY